MGNINYLLLNILLADCMIMSFQYTYIRLNELIQNIVPQLGAEKNISTYEEK